MQCDKNNLHKITIQNKMQMKGIFLTIALHQAMKTQNFACVMNKKYTNNGNPKFKCWCEKMLMIT